MIENELDAEVPVREVMVMKTIGELSSALPKRWSNCHGPDADPARAGCRQAYARCFSRGRKRDHHAGGPQFAAEDLAECVLVGDGGKLKELADERRGISLDGIEIVDVTDEEANAACCERYLSHPDCKFKPKGAVRRMTRPLERALILQVLGDVDVMFAVIYNATGQYYPGGSDHRRPC